MELLPSLTVFFRLVYITQLRVYANIMTNNNSVVADS